MGNAAGKMLSAFPFLRPDLSLPSPARYIRGILLEKDRAMFEAAVITGDSKPVIYGELAQMLEALLHGEPDAIANAANMSALIFTSLPDLNWRHWR